ncbi:MAG: hypothetical protein US50_C0034G0004 [Candidatus Nomurabacteria bacterium GW2011_GWB1_37_5]|uniref:Restriction endonuclease type IV Mrr domain-containing protein n=1 Tax=Candidatus Nomurabacteria bacterium GW2011_GWB1_37_5 TaxID=1618742 RepID=A0A0G0GV15_9BACT|nr:MAG: hypothetical protein US50_C0034G0004 [Candidatus Nomurabacteria bacterium GW2011_GWB1_37_5]
MKQGKEYEDFVYKIFSEFFKNFSLTQNDRIIGMESGLLREIDVSIRGKIDNINLLFVVQAKDYKNHKSDINVIGNFSSVIRDIGASKGFLVCASGFAKTNSQYARTLGIELLSVEDIESKKWRAVIEIPVIYIDYDINYKINIPLFLNMCNELKQLNGGNDDLIAHRDKFNFSIDAGNTFLHINDHIVNLIKEKKINFIDKKEIIFTPSLRLLRYPSFEFPGSSLTIEPKKKFYLKYIIPDEYRGIKDHLNETFIPTTIKISNIPLKLDGSFTLIDQNKIPINPIGFSINIENTLIN